jgi:CheY-like chemotaxis protein
MQRILLVEDSRVTQLTMQRLLTKVGYEVVIAQDGEQAIRAAATVLPDVILLDMLLPKVDGPGVMAHLKRNLATAHIPVIVLTGLSSKNAMKLKEAGASAFIEKTQILDDSSVLLNALNNLLPTGSMLAVPPENRLAV